MLQNIWQAWLLGNAKINYVGLSSLRGACWTSTLIAKSQVVRSAYPPQSSALKSQFCPHSAMTYFAWFSLLATLTDWLVFRKAVLCVLREVQYELKLYTMEMRIIFNLGRGMAQAAIRRLSLRRSGARILPAHLRYMMNEVALDRISSEYFVYILPAYSINAPSSPSINSYRQYMPTNLQTKPCSFGYGEALHRKVYAFLLRPLSSGMWHRVVW